MILAWVSGGLGNQLFCYAAARSVSLRHRTSLVLDASKYAGEWGDSPSRPFLLDFFPLKATIRHAGPEMERKGLVRRAWRRVREDFISKKVNRDRGNYGYFDGFRNIPARARMDGYFISPRFFSDWSKEIRKELSLSEDFLISNNDFEGEEFRREMSGNLTVGVHIRRGDFLTYSGPVKLYLPEFEAYIYRAVKYFTEILLNPTFVVVSDDLDWSRLFFDKLGVVYRVAPTGLNTRFSVMRDFFLLSRCDHQIMSNSTFSWWAAWMTHREKKEVLMPPRWDASNITPIEEMRLYDWKVLRV